MKKVTEIHRKKTIWEVIQLDEPVSLEEAKQMVENDDFDWDKDVWEDISNTESLLVPNESVGDTTVEYYAGEEELANNYQEPSQIPAWAKNINWALLSKQKQKLLETMQDLGGNNIQEEKAEALDGIINLLDTIQDWASDDLKIPSVFPEDLGLPDTEPTVSIHVEGGNVLGVFSDIAINVRLYDLDNEPDRRTEMIALNETLSDRM